MTDTKIVEMASDDNKKTPCKYGALCYQKGSTHLKKYSHPKREVKYEPLLQFVWFYIGYNFF